MDFMGMGPLEILLVLIVGLLVLGPEKLPAMAAKAGELYRKLTKVTSTLSKSITEEISAETKATSDLTKSITEEISAGARAISELGKSITQEIPAKTKTKETEKTPPATAPDEKSAK